MSYDSPITGVDDPLKNFYLVSLSPFRHDLIQLQSIVWVKLCLPLLYAE